MIDDPKEDGAEQKPAGTDNPNIRESDPNPDVPTPKPTPATWPAPTPRQQR